MNCNNGSNCQGIANKYGTQKSSLNSSLNSMRSNISEISNSLNGFTIPDDYIGSKIKEKMININNGILASTDNISSFSAGVNAFIDDKKAVHERHYSDWKRRQDELKASEKDGDVNG